MLRFHVVHLTLIVVYKLTSPSFVHLLSLPTEVILFWVSTVSRELEISLTFALAHIDRSLLHATLASVPIRECTSIVRVVIEGRLGLKVVQGRRSTLLVQCLHKFSM